MTCCLILFITLCLAASCEKHEPGVKTGNLGFSFSPGNSVSRAG